MGREFSRLRDDPRADADAEVAAPVEPGPTRPDVVASDRRARAAGKGDGDLRGDPIGDMWAIERIDLDDRGSP